MFEVTQLLDGRTLVEGTDAKGVAGSIVLYSPTWEAVLRFRAEGEAMAEFDATVEAFFAPLTEAADKLEAAALGTSNPWGTVTVGEDIEGKEAREVHLDQQGILLRLLAETDGAMLRWVSNGTELVAVSE
jgi:succinate dehydrogenase flavin-adding protein (antitoxin of CptAB toxin-antitoxin module)